ncbi:MAG: metallophosphoesterase family protein [Candidatus Heimdallarchaeota archaeon]|nr:metallophosphoesterase family protein [Candidatus Heimdallarchaeota archaeon]
MRILALSDTHFGHMYGNTAQARKESIHNMFEAFENALEIAKEKEVDVVLHGGDMFNRSKPPKPIISKAYSIIEDFSRSGIKFVGIPGNHDKSVLPETLMSHFNEDVYFQNKLARVDFGAISVISFPYEFRNPLGTFLKLRREIEKDSRQSFIILNHQLFNGATFGPHRFEFKNRIDALITDSFPRNAQLFLSGHIHRAQRIQNNRVYYTGSTERTSFMESIEPKGCLLIDIEPNSVHVKFIELNSKPMEIIELNIEQTKMISKKLDTLVIEKDKKVLIRLTGRILEYNEIKLLWSYFPAKEYPLLTFTPRKPAMKLRSLFTISKLPLNL